MNRLAIAALAAATLGVTGCATSGFSGALYADNVRPHTTDTHNNGACPKIGTGAASSILGLVSTGDAGVENAKKQAGITEVISVDVHNSSLLGLFATTTVRVCGK